MVLKLPSFLHWKRFDVKHFLLIDKSTVAEKERKLADLIGQLSELRHQLVSESGCVDLWYLTHNGFVAWLFHGNAMFMKKLYFLILRLGSKCSKKL